MAYRWIAKAAVDELLITFLADLLELINDFLALGSGIGHRQPFPFLRDLLLGQIIVECLVLGGEGGRHGILAEGGGDTGGDTHAGELQGGRLKLRCRVEIAAPARTVDTADGLIDQRIEDRRAGAAERPRQRILAGQPGGRAADGGMTEDILGCELSCREPDRIGADGGEVGNDA